MFENDPSDARKYLPEQLEQLSAGEFLRICGADYDRNEDGGLVVTANFTCEKLGLTRLPDLSNVIFLASFSCAGNHLKSLHGSPAVVEGMYNCSDNQLETLVGCTPEIGAAFNCRDNELETLEGGPLRVRGSYFCHRNNLRNLKGAPRVVPENFIAKTNNLVTLEGVPDEIGGSLYINGNPVTNLDEFPAKIGRHFYISTAQTISLKNDLKKFGLALEKMSLSDDPVNNHFNKEHVQKYLDARAAQKKAEEDYKDSIKKALKPAYKFKLR